MNPNLKRLQPYPFQKLAQLKAGSTSPSSMEPIDLSMGEPQHPAPGFAIDELINQLPALAQYPKTRGTPALRKAIARWLKRRFTLPSGAIDPERHILPVNGTREALFSFAQCIINQTTRRPLVLIPNPFYQIYEGATLLAGAEPWFMNTTLEHGFLPDFDAVPQSVWERCQLLYICNPGNPSGAVIRKQRLQELIQLADRFEFVIAADECYSEIYLDEEKPPTGLLEAAVALGNTDFHNCIVFHSLSKRSNLPGLRSGFVAGDEQVIQSFLQYRTYHGSAMSLPTQAASLRVWQDESHVVENRAIYREKMNIAYPLLPASLSPNLPEGGFYFWLALPMDDQEFTKALYQQYNLTVLPGSYLSREAHGINPGRNYVRIALVASVEECREAMLRIRSLLDTPALQKY